MKLSQIYFLNIKLTEMLYQIHEIYGVHAMSGSMVNCLFLMKDTKEVYDENNRG